MNSEVKSIPISFKAAVTLIRIIVATSVAIVSGAATPGNNLIMCMIMLRPPSAAIALCMPASVGKEFSWEPTSAAAGAVPVSSNLLRRRGAGNAGSQLCGLQAASGASTGTSTCTASGSTSAWGPQFVKDAGQTTP